MAVTLMLPPGRRIFVSAFTNAAYLQKVVITPPAGAGDPITWQGTGEDNNQIGQQFITTPAGSQDLAYSVGAQYSSDNGATWQDSSLLPGGTTIGSMNLKVMLSEDHVDQDFNDAVVQFLWCPPVRAKNSSFLEHFLFYPFFYPQRRSRVSGTREHHPAAKPRRTARKTPLTAMFRCTLSPCSASP